jgi:hypothetical protein
MCSLCWLFGDVVCWIPGRIVISVSLMS